MYCQCNIKHELACYWTYGGDGGDGGGGGGGCSIRL